MGVQSYRGHWGWAMLLGVGLLSALACGASLAPSVAAPTQPTIVSQLSATPTTLPLSPYGVTYYVRVDGGSTEQCTGLADAPYPGNGVAQPCAWDHPFRALPPGGTPRIAGGDTLLIAAGAYRMGYGAPGAEACDEAGSYDCHMPPIPSGPDAAHPTRLLGAGWNSGCAAAPELWGTGRPWFILNLTDSSHVEVACLEITDHSSCIEDHLAPSGGSPYTCQRETPPYGDWAAFGLYAEDSSDVFLHHLNIHGLAAGGVHAGRLSDWTVEDVRIVGNGSVGWDGDLWDDNGDANSGTLTFRRWTVAWNGCGETYPDEQHVACWGQEAGGYGDGVGTGLTGGHWVIEDAAFLHNTSDGLDLLYARLPGVSIEIRRTLAEGNDGNQIKFTASQGLIENSIIVSHCGFFHGMPYWNNGDDCRAGGDALAVALQPAAQVSLVNSTLSGEGGCLMIAECAWEQTCNGSETVLVSNTLFQGQKIFFNPAEDTCFAWYDDESNPPMPANPFAVSYSLITATRFGNVTPCPGPHNVCDVPAGLVDAAIDSFDAHLTAGSPAINAGTTSGAPAVDFDGRLRDALPDVGAYEWRQPSSRLYLPAILRQAH